MKKILVTLLLGGLLVTSCSSTSTSIFGNIGNRTPREKYEDRLEDRDLDKKPEGRQWLAASEKALQSPVAIALPYRQEGHFSPDKPRALGLQFTAKKGERLSFSIDKNEASRFLLFAELFQLNGASPELLEAVDTTVSEFIYDIAETGTYVLTLQPELFGGGLYDLSINVGPSIGFPVAGSKAYVGSVWGDVRDGGKRSHEGIDIFAAKGTPAIASEDGYVTSVKEGGIGGKVVWLRPSGKNYTLYYAHLDKQLVDPGQFVKKGDTVGLVGNTGNARSTPPHLHFGIYGFGGAVDPLPFVNKKIRTAPDVPAKKLSEPLRLTKTLKWVHGEVKANTVILPLAVSSKAYIVELPDGSLVQAGFNLVQPATRAIKKAKAAGAAALYPAPAKGTPPQLTIQPGSPVSVLGYFNEFVLVRSGNQQGWVLETSLNG